eukprot:jgi/Botrbrau1/17812/Bobra.0127s0059.2
MTPQGKEFTSLLFTPRTADKPNQPDYRSSRSVRSPSAGRASASGFGRLSSFRDSGSFGGGSTRRRSLTPTGSLKDFAPPPASSLFDSPAGPPSAPPAPSNNPPFPGFLGASAAGDDGQQLALRNHFLRQAQPAEEVNVTWVTVFGFPPSAETLIMQEFSRCGDILHFVSGRDDAVNWTHIQYANKYQAQRALAKNGELLNGQLMIGVKIGGPVNPANVNRSDGGELRVPQQAAPPRLYVLPTGASESLLAQPSETTWGKVWQYVLGL